ncbi:predicted protein [Arabidopsis lyrata subsp. lyrata]|uniref:Predicted protein n=1 Tax=Arabidopsis lyrata subsp. lyrata TaxID=81972 RepID=D7LM85_ARALL|nr:predicted protein [Arabidopsis lyrata subsp. lyrata]
MAASTKETENEVPWEFRFLGLRSSSFKRLVVLGVLQVAHPKVEEKGSGVVTAREYFCFLVSVGSQSQSLEAFDYEFVLVNIKGGVFDSLLSPIIEIEISTTETENWESRLLVLRFSGFMLDRVLGDLKVAFPQMEEEISGAVTAKESCRFIISAGPQSQSLEASEKSEEHYLDFPILFERNLMVFRKFFGRYLLGSEIWGSQIRLIESLQNQNLGEVEEEQLAEDGDKVDTNQVSDGEDMDSENNEEKLKAENQLVADGVYGGMGRKKGTICLQGISSMKRNAHLLTSPRRRHVQKGVKQLTEGRNPRNQDMVKGMAGGDKPPKHKGC